MLNVFFKYKYYFLFSLAFFISSIGTSFTTIAVYSQLIENNASTFFYTLAFSAGILPGLFVSFWSGKKASKLPIYNVIMFAFLASLILLLIPTLGFKTNNIYLLLFSEAVASMASGLLIPFCKFFEKLTFKNNHLKFLATYDTIFFTATFIFGQGLGSILITHFTWKTFLTIDALTYIASLLIIFLIRDKLQIKNTLPIADKNQKTVYSFTQTKTLYLFVWISIICSPLMAVIPSVGSKFSNHEIYGLHPELALLCSRTIGQIIGPIAILLMGKRKLPTKQKVLFSFLGAYILFYSFSFYSSNIFYACSFIIIAHIFSNITFTIANFQLLNQFDENQMGHASAWVYRYMTLAMGLAALISGAIVDVGGYSALIAISSMFFCIALLTAKSQTLNTLKNKEVLCE